MAEDQSKIVANLKKAGDAAKKLNAAIGDIEKKKAGINGVADATNNVASAMENAKNKTKEAEREIQKQADTLAKAKKLNEEALFRMSNAERKVQEDFHKSRQRLIQDERTKSREDLLFKAEQLNKKNKLAKESWTKEYNATEKAKELEQKLIKKYIPQSQEEYNKLLKESSRHDMKAIEDELKDEAELERKANIQKLNDKAESLRKEKNIANDSFKQKLKNSIDASRQEAKEKEKIEKESEEKSKRRREYIKKSLGGAMGMLWGGAKIAGGAALGAGAAALYGAGKVGKNMLFGGADAFGAGGSILGSVPLVGGMLSGVFSRMQQGMQQMIEWSKAALAASPYTSSRGLRGALGSGLGGRYAYDPGEVAGIAGTVGQVYGDVNNRSLAMAMRLQRGYGINIGEGGALLRGANIGEAGQEQAFTKMIADGFYSGLGKGRIGEYIKAMSQYITSNQMAKGYVNILGTSTLTGIMGKVGGEMFRGTRGLEYLAQLDQTIANPKSAGMEYILNNIFGLYSGKSFYDVTKARQIGITGMASNDPNQQRASQDVFMQLFSGMNKFFPDRQVANLALSRETGLSIPVIEQLQAVNDKLQAGEQLSEKEREEMKKLLQKDALKEAAEQSMKDFRGGKDLQMAMQFHLVALWSKSGDILNTMFKMWEQEKKVAEFIGKYLPKALEVTIAALPAIVQVLTSIADFTLRNVEEYKKLGFQGYVGKKFTDYWDWANRVEPNRMQMIEDPFSTRGQLSLTARTLMGQRATYGFGSNTMRFGGGATPGGMYGTQKPSEWDSWTEDQRLAWLRTNDWDAFVKRQQAHNMKTYRSDYQPGALGQDWKWAEKPFFGLFQGSKSPDYLSREQIIQQQLDRRGQLGLQSMYTGEAIDAGDEITITVKKKSNNTTRDMRTTQ